MFRIFRIIRKTLVEKNHVKKYTIYAIGEIFLVVLGILIALQINNWNENQKQRREEGIILSSLLDDLKIAADQSAEHISDEENAMNRLILALKEKERRNEIVNHSKADSLFYKIFWILKQEYL